jgi:hypothetical protein
MMTSGLGARAQRIPFQASTKVWLTKETPGVATETTPTATQNVVVGHDVALRVPPSGAGGLALWESDQAGNACALPPTPARPLHVSAAASSHQRARLTTGSQIRPMARPAPPFLPPSSNDRDATYIRNGRGATLRGTPRTHGIVNAADAPALSLHNLPSCSWLPSADILETLTGTLDAPNTATTCIRSSIRAVCA